VICTPIKAGTYEVTIKASTDNTKTDSVTITAIEPDVLSVGGAESEYKISMVRVEKTGDGGEDDQGFLMGCTRNEGGYTSTNCANNARYEHTVQLTQDYYIGKYEVTLKQWKQVAHSVPENAVTEFDGSPNDNLPVTWVSYQDVGKFIDGLNNIGEYATTDYAVPGMKWALPTEAQWEYAARGGNKPTNCPNAPNADKWGCLYSGSSWFGNVAWQQTNSNGTIHPVGTVVPPEAPDAPADSSNELGVFDMSGNVSEWVYDWLTRHTTEPRKDYSGPEAGNSHVFRGGSFEQSYVYTTVAWRGPANDFGDYADGTKGFRLALVPDPDYIPGSDK
jgi:formylglycine-generating enzyme required for sulfatase activity